MTIAEQGVEIVSPVDLRWLEQWYIFRERVDVTQALEEYPFLVPLLLEAHDKILRYFPDAQLFLEAIADPEATDDSQLVAFVATGLAPSEALSRLEQFDKVWWLDALERAQGKL